MRRVIGRINVLVLWLGATACHQVLPYEAGRADALSADAGVTDGHRGDAPDGQVADGPAVDRPAPDGAGIDGSGAGCQLGQPLGPLQLSQGNSSAGRPAVARYGGDFFVAYTQNDQSHLVQVDPAGPVRRRTHKIIIGEGSPRQPALASDGQSIAMAWHQEDPASCSWPVQIAAGSLDTQSQLVLDPACELATACPDLPYGPVALAYHGGKYLLAAGLGLSSSSLPCPVGETGKVSFFSQLSGCPQPAAWLPCTEGPLASQTGYVAAAAAPSVGPFAFSLLSLETSGSSYDLKLYQHDGSSWSQVVVSAKAAGEQPALVDDGTGRWIAWRPPLPSTEIAVRHLAAASTAEEPLAPGPGYQSIREPALAARPAGNGAGVLLAYSAWVAALPAPHPAAIRAVMLEVRPIDQAAPIDVFASAPGASLVEQPRTPAVAASPEGFGVAWLQNVDSQTEVFFSFVPCVP